MIKISSADTSFLFRFLTRFTPRSHYTVQYPDHPRVCTSSLFPLLPPAPSSPYPQAASFLPLHLALSPHTPTSHLTLLRLLFVIVLSGRLRALRDVGQGSDVRPTLLGRLARSGKPSLLTRVTSLRGSSSGRKRSVALLRSTSGLGSRESRLLLLLRRRGVSLVLRLGRGLGRHRGVLLHLRLLVVVVHRPHGHA